MNPQIEAAKSEFERTSGRLLSDLDATPDDKLTWSPSPSARTPLELVYHCAMVVGGIHGSLDGSNPMPHMTTEQIDTFLRENEVKHGSKDEVVKVFQDSSAAYVAWLETLTEEKLGDKWDSPFGEIPYTVAISLPTYHTANHIGQLEYIQTIYGDRIWH
jgi:hypothetical protein